MQNKTDGGSPERFGYEWCKYSDIVPQYEEQFRRWLPFFGHAEWRNKHFLDVGCGMGRNSLWPMTYGAAGGAAIDIDDRSLAAARRTLTRYPSVDVRKCSAYELPWSDEFDISFSIGVIHHLDAPNIALKCITDATKPGGSVAIWVYGRENIGWFLWCLDPARKLLFSRLPISAIHALSLPPTALLWLLLRSGFDHLEYFRLLRQFSFRHLRSIVFDQMLPRVANYWTKEEVEALMRGAGLEGVELASVNEMSWAACGRKPLR